MVGFGYDSHRLVKSKRFVLGGIEIDYEKGIDSHSDGDAVYHALCDAILGGGGKGDIGEHFPDSDAKYKGISSEVFVMEAVKMIEKENLKVVNVDVTIVLEEPKIKNYKNSIKKNIAKLCHLEDKYVNVKAKTSEKMGFVGRGEGIEVYCVCEIGYS
jgi:2-C-methyl-D-erythritol 2,4-cyclodiphosphate synthase